MTTDTTHDPATEPDPRFWLGVFLPTAGVLLGALTLCLGWSTRLPSSVAQKWDWSTQEVITVAPLWLGVISLAIPSAAVLILLVFLKWSGRLTGWGRSLSIAVLASIVAFTAASLPVMLSGQVGLEDPLLAPDPRIMMGITAALSLVYGILAALIAGGRPLASPIPGTTPTTALDLEPNEIAVWTTTTTAWVCLLGGSLPGLVLIVLGITTPIWGLTIAGGMLLALGIITGRWTITVDHKGLTCTTLFGFGRFTAPATPGATAEVVTVRGLSEFLGWGIRIGGSRSIGLIFRNGEALRVHRPDGYSLTVTTNDATTAAALFNAQTTRHHATH
ncbi:hypothetical protein ACX80N_04595 [Arthrobacter sp. MDT2-16]